LHQNGIKQRTDHVGRLPDLSLDISMPVVRITMREIKDVLRWKMDEKLSHEQFATAPKRSKGVVANYVGLAAAAALDWPSFWRAKRRRSSDACWSPPTTAHLCGPGQQSHASRIAPYTRDLDAALGGVSDR
jgi:hypothetical protein